MENSYTTLHRNLDNRILTLENETHPNQSLITDLKKQKLRLKDNMVATVNEQLDLFLDNEKERKYKQLQSMIHTQKRRDKKKRQERKKRLYAQLRKDKVSLSG